MASLTVVTADTIERTLGRQVGSEGWWLYGTYGIRQYAVDTWVYLLHENNEASLAKVRFLIAAWCIRGVDIDQTTLDVKNGFSKQKTPRRPRDAHVTDG